MRLLFALVTVAALFVADSATALTGTPGDEIIFLNKDCAAAGHTLGGDCFETVAGVQNAIWGPGGIHPTAAAPLIVDIGPGTFDGQVACGQAQGYTTFRGAGRERSIITYSSTVLGVLSATVHILDCASLSFQDVTIRNTANTASNSAMLIVEGAGKVGSINLTNVNLVSTYGFAWYEAGCSGPPVVDHFVFGSKIVGGKHAIVGACGRSWWFGSDILLQPVSTQDGGVFQSLTAVVAHTDGDVRVFGSTIRVAADDLPPGTSEVVGVRLGPQGFPGGEFHMHGGIINVTTKQAAGVQAVGIDNATPGALSHTLGTAFVVMSAAGTDSVRLSGSGNIQAPLLWQSGTAPPNTGVAGTVVSQNGQDIFVETDCDSSGCNGSGTDPHLMIYKDDCPNSKWFDVVRDQCRD